MSMVPSERRTTIGQESRVTVGLLVAACGGIGLMIWRGAAWTTAVDSRLERIETNKDDRWRGMDMRHWTESLHELNPELHIPAVITEQNEDQRK